VNSTGTTGVPISIGIKDNNGSKDGITNFTRTYNQGTGVTLSAPTTFEGLDYNFVSWSGCGSSAPADPEQISCAVTFNGNTTVTANYAADPIYTLTVNSTGANGVAVGVSPADKSGAANGSTNFTRSYDGGTRISLTAPYIAGGNDFVSWAGCTSASTIACDVDLKANTTITAKYVPNHSYALTVKSTGANGVEVGVLPADNSGASDGTTTFTRTYDDWTTVTLTAPIPAGGYQVVNWSGCTSVSNNICTVLLSSDTTVTAAYTNTVVLSVDACDDGSGNGRAGCSLAVDGVLVSASPADMNGSGGNFPPFSLTYNYGTTVTLVTNSEFSFCAPPNQFDGYFAAWSGCTQANSETCTVDLKVNTSVTALYTVDWTACH
jgi:hypothetical protein